MKNADKDYVDQNVSKDDPALFVTIVDSTDAACKGAQNAVKKILESSPIRLGGSGINFNIE